MKQIPTLARWMPLFLILLAAGCAAIPTTVSTGIPTSTPVIDSSQPTNQVVATSTSALVPVTGSTPAAGSNGETVYTIVAAKSEARYRVREQLARLSFPSDAVGKSSQITGSIAVKSDGTIDSTNSKIVVDASTLATDSGMRDNFVRNNILQTGQYQNVVFIPTKVTGLPWPLPASGDLHYQLTGNLTIRDVTKEVTWDVTGKVQGDQATGTATVSFSFEDFKLSQPTIAIVLSVEDKITLEFDINLQKAP